MIDIRVIVVDWELNSPTPFSQKKPPITTVSSSWRNEDRSNKTVDRMEGLTRKMAKPMNLNFFVAAVLH